MTRGSCFSGIGFQLCYDWAIAGGLRKIGGCTYLEARGCPKPVKLLASVRSTDGYRAFCMGSGRRIDMVYQTHHAKIPPPSKAWKVGKPAKHFSNNLGPGRNHKMMFCSV